MAQPLQSATLDVPLAPLNQHATKTGGPVGRIKKMLNAVVKKITSTAPTAQAAATAELRVEKRDGFASLPSTVRDPATGAISSKTLVGPTLFGTYGAQLIAIFLAAPFVLSEAAACWESPTYNAPTRVLRANGIYNGSTISATPDEARIGTRTLYAWSDLGAGGLYLTMVMVIDDDGTIIRQPFSVDAVRRVRACADGTQFWVIWDTGAGGIQTNAYDTNGNFLGTGSVASSGTGYFDVTLNTASANSIVMLQKDPASGGVKFARFTWNGATVTVFQQVPFTINNSVGRDAFLTNDRGDHAFHIVTVDGTGPFTTYVTVIADSTLTLLAGSFVVKTGDAVAPVEASGFVAPTGNADYVIGLSYLNATPTPQLNSTLVYAVTAAGVSTLKRTQISLTLASRAFRMQVGGDYYAVGYYHSNPAGFTSISQSTYFLMDFGTGYQVTGRFEFGTAYQDWLTTADTTRYMYVSTPQVDPNGGIHMALAYRASSTIAVTTTGDTFTPTKTLVDVVGIKDYSFGPDNGQSVEHSAALFLPGPETVNYTGATFAEDGIGLIPEVTAIATAGGGSLAGTYEYVVCDEWTDNNGQRVRSPSGVPVSITVSAAQVQLTGLHNHVTRKSNMTHAIYRTVIKGGVQTTEHYKVSGSLQGGAFLGSVVVNDDAAQTWTFVDNMIDSVASNNEVLYTDKGLLDHFPAPPFSVGLATFDRIFVAGYDGAIWFSGAKTEGDAFWYHPGQRIPLPTQEEVRSIRMLDDMIVVLCSGDTVFAIPNGPWPDATGQGAFPAPRVLPFSNGCTGFAETISDGIIYSATQGGIWLITRDFQNRFIGAPIEDEKASFDTFAGVATDDRQRTVFLTAGGNMLVYDQVTGVWGNWLTSPLPRMLTVHKGRIAYIPVSGPPLRQVLGQYFDGNGNQIITSVRIRVAPGGIRRYKRLWQVQMVGEWLGDHDMTVLVYMDDSPTFTFTASQRWTPDSAVPYIYELPANAQTEMCGAVEYSFHDEFPRGPSQGFALEALSLQIGLGDRSKDLPASRRIGI
jgi:hypothetical protein